MFVVTQRFLPAVWLVLASASAVGAQQTKPASASKLILRVAEQAIPETEGEEPTVTQTAPPPNPQSGRLAGESIYGSDRYVAREKGLLKVPPLSPPTTDLNKIGNGIVPPAVAEPEVTTAQPLPEGPERAGDWSLIAYRWQAPNTYSHPRYFEDVMLERHGHERFRALQPLVSGFRFFATVPMLPYLSVVRPPCDTEYTLGYSRPGSRAPRRLQRPPYERNAMLFQAAVSAGF